MCLFTYEYLTDEVLFSPNNMLEEEIFTPRTLDPDFDIISGMLYRFGGLFILSAQGKWLEARAVGFDYLE